MNLIDVFALYCGSGLEVTEIIDLDQCTIHYWYILFSLALLWELAVTSDAHYVQLCLS